MQDSNHAVHRRDAARLSSPKSDATVGFWLMIGLLALFAGGKAILYDTLDPDCFWHLRVAAQLHRDGIGPIVDDLSFASSKQPWTPYSWLAELGMKSLWDFGGYRAAIAVTAILQGLIVMLLAACCVEMQQTRKMGTVPIFDLTNKAENSIIASRKTWAVPIFAAGNPRYLSAVIATTIGTFLILPYLSFRPVLMAFVLLFTIAWLVLRDQRRYASSQRMALDVALRLRGPCDAGDPRRREATSTTLFTRDVRSTSGLGYQKLVWCIVPLTALLTNIHLFSFFVPAAVFAMAFGAMLEQDSRNAMRYSRLATATALACLATPMLPGLIKTIFFYSAQDKMVTGPVIAEMQFFARGPMGWIAGAGAVVLLGCIAVGYRRLPIGQLICVAVATLLLLKLGRFAPLFALAACPALAATMPALSDRILAKPALSVLLTAVLVLGLGRITVSFPGRSVSLATWVNRHGPDTPGYPCTAADFVDRSVAHSTGHLVNEFSWGGYLAWRLDGKYQVLLDGRTQVYPQSLWQATYLGSDIERQNFLAGVQADAALLPAGKSKLRAALLHLGWTRVYKDDRAEVLIPPGGFARIE